jgi:hypothetical protein
MARIYTEHFAFGNCEAIDAEGPAAIARVEALLFRLSLFAAVTSLSIPSGCVSTADRALLARAPLAGFALAQLRASRGS